MGSISYATGGRGAGFNGIWRQPCKWGLWFEHWIVVLHRMHALCHVQGSESDVPTINFETSITLYHVPILPIC